MRNLAGISECDNYIQEELRAAGIDVVSGERHPGEVAASLTGRLGAFAFRRAWSYWMVNGPMPLDAAKRLNEMPMGFRRPGGRVRVGKAGDVVRVVGFAGGADPVEWATRRVGDSREVRPATERENDVKNIPRLWATLAALNAKVVYDDDPASARAGAYVESYHIDTQEGLNLFAETVRSLQGIAAGATSGQGAGSGGDARAATSESVLQAEVATESK